jgi:uncharacterized membrane protein HdeD (DUF308 family)
VISVIAGIVLLITPFESIVQLALIAGGAFFVIGLCEIVASFAIRKAVGPGIEARQTR